MKKSLSLVLLPLVAGCLSSSVPEVSHWMLNYQSSRAPVGAAKYGVARVAHVLVRAPYRERAIVVLRADGSFALDRYNEYVADPSQLLRGVIADALVETHLFSAVIASTSLAKSDVTVEVEVTSLSLDCRDASSRKAVAELVVRLVGSGGRLLKTAVGSGSAAAATPNFGEPLSKAFSQALGQALDGLD